MTTHAALSDVLMGGEWVRDGMVWRWARWPAVEVPAEEETPPSSHRPHDLIACPTCLARMDESCKTFGGHSHKSRLVKRVCSCGEAVRPREPMCGFCRAEMARGSAA